MKNDAYQVLVSQIVAEMEKGVVPWEVPWKSGSPRSLSTDKPYRGFNALVLGFDAQKYSTPFYATFNQIRDKGGVVKKGEKSTAITFWKKQEVEDKKAKTTKELFFCRNYHVFNVDQAEWKNGEPENVKKWRESAGIQTHEPAESIIEKYPDRPKIEFGGDAAFYSPATDSITLPPRDNFINTEAFYQTLFHEITHSTGHPKRLNRFSKSDRPSLEEYSKEELTAEIGAAFLCQNAGIAPRVSQSAAYCKTWLSRLKEDPRVLVSAAQLAAKSTDHVLGVGAETITQFLDFVPAHKNAGQTRTVMI